MSSASFWGSRFPLYRALAILIVLLIGFGFTLSAFQRNNELIFSLRGKDWQMAPAPSFSDARPPESGWQSYNTKEIRAEQAYWLRIPLPAAKLDDPHLQIRNFSSMKVYDRGTIHYEYAYNAADKRTKNGFSWKFIPLSAPLSDEIYLLVQYSKHFPIDSRIGLGNKADLLDAMFRYDIDNLVLGFLLLFCSLIGLGLFASQRDALYLYFSLLSFTGGFGALVCNHLFMVLWNSPVPGHFQDACMPVGAYAFIGALSHLYPDIYRRVLRFFRRLLLLYSALTIASALFSFAAYVQAVVAFAPLFLVVLSLAFWTMSTAYRAKQDVESVWILAGFLSLVTITGIHMYRVALYTFFPREVNALLRWMFELPVDLLFWGLFAFVVCLIRVIVHRYTAMNRQLTEFNRSLEQAVQTRTAQLRERKEQLESAHENLGASIRENAEALAEAMRLEERHRITGSIHHTVGQTLSATIVQLEAAKRLIERDRLLAEEKLESAQSLIRTGLEDIRRSVRILREDDSYYDLVGSLGALFRDAEQSRGCIVEYDFNSDSLPDTLDTLQKRVVFQTLQQGIDLGVKMNRGRPCSFRLSVHMDAAWMNLRFVRLDAAPPSAADLEFGLQTIAERAERIGGSLTSETDRLGFALKLSLPLVSHDSFDLHRLG
ncbi:histidine kinase [Cohnella sp.]|uniref:sensor histidine kinase n=1 Tax=Cohnella sp. TaxID=1883426 RepID=UPI0035648C49